MLGHLAIARELYQEGNKTASYPHFAHPYQEVYESLEPAFEARGIAPFEDQLEALSERARQGGGWSDLEPAFAQVLTTIRTAMSDVEDDIEMDPAFQARVQLALLKTALQEYDEAVEDGSFHDVLEYQDGRGFVLTARESLETHAELFRQAGAYDALVSGYEKVLKAWPDAEAPATPVMSVGDLSAALFSLEVELGRFEPDGP
ncbi:hypothetical protein ACUN9Y_20705 [Halomonas sp. V046]|uniref:hypothetical protein n=1 Tax=Halomonas sp. V046 TaxID=3459611 RepID=UPI004043FFD1